MSEPIVLPRLYVVFYIILLILTLSTVLFGYFNLGWFSMLLALAIATAKASLIAMFFMHAFYEKPLVWLLIAGALLWFAFLMTLTLCDYITRGWFPAPGK
jgi:cytochrome c oxidase subunit 4